MKRWLNEAVLILIAIPVVLWTMVPLYHLFVLAISPQDAVLAGQLWPEHPTFSNFVTVFRQQHYYLSNFWLQLGNSFLIAVTTGIATLFVATCAAFAISRLRAPGGRQVMNLRSATSSSRSMISTKTARMMMPANTPTASKLPSERAIR